MASEAKLLVVQFLQWVAARPRGDRELREAWSSTCPLTCAWEDAIAEDLVRRGADGYLALTASGRARLAAANAPAARSPACDEATPEYRSLYRRRPSSRPMQGEAP